MFVGLGAVGVPGLALAHLYNSGFSPDLAGWTVRSFGGVGSPGSAVAEAGGASLREGDGFLVVLQQDFTTSTGRPALTFTYELDPGFDDVEVGFADAFEVHLLDELGAPLLSPWRDRASAFLNVQQDGTVRHGEAVTVDDGLVTLDLSEIPAGVTATLVFALVGADAGTTSAIRVGDVSFGVSSTAPTADAGANFAVACGDPVPLDGSLSSDLDGDPLAYFWRDDQGTLLGSGVTLELPGLPVGVHDISLTVDDGLGNASTAVVEVTVEDEDDPVVLTPGRIVVPDDGTCGAEVPNLAWVKVEDCDAVTLTQLPLPGTRVDYGTPVVVTLTAEDGSENIGTADVTIVVSTTDSACTGTAPSNDPPVADAGADLVATCPEGVVLDGSGSTDPDGDALTYTWRAVTFDENEDPVLGDVLGTGATLALDFDALDPFFGARTYALTVDDGLGGTDTDLVVVTFADDVPTFESVRTAWFVEAGEDCLGEVPEIALSPTTVIADCTEVTRSQSVAPRTMISLEAPVVVTLTAEDASENVATVDVTVTVVDSDGSCFPVAVAGIDQLLECGDDVILDGSASSSPADFALTFAWHEGETLLDDTDLVNLGALSTGVRTYALTVTDVRGAAHSDTVVVTVQDTIDPQISGLASTFDDDVGSTCKGEIPNFVAQATVTDCELDAVTQDPPAGTLVWNDTPTPVVVRAVDLSENDATHEVLVTFDDPGDACTPVADAGVGSTLTCGQTVVLDGSASLDPKGEGLLYTWTNAALEEVGAEDVVAVPWLGFGEHVFTLSIMDAGGQISTDVVTYDIDDEDDPVFFLYGELRTVPLDELCEAEVPDLTAEVLALDCSTVTYTQDVLAGTPLALGTPELVTVTVTDAAGNDAFILVDVIAVDRTGACTPPDTADTGPGDSDTDTDAGDTDPGLAQPIFEWLEPVVRGGEGYAACGAGSLGNEPYTTDTRTVSQSILVTVPAATAVELAAGRADMYGGPGGWFRQRFQVFSEYTAHARSAVLVSHRELRIGLTDVGTAEWHGETPWTLRYDGFRVARDPDCPASLEEHCADLPDPSNVTWAPGPEDFEVSLFAVLPDHSLMYYFCVALEETPPNEDVVLAFTFEWTSRTECWSQSGFAGALVENIFAEDALVPAVAAVTGPDCAWYIENPNWDDSDPGDTDTDSPADTDTDGQPDTDTDADTDTDGAPDTDTDIDTGGADTDTDGPPDTDETDTDGPLDTDDTDGPGDTDDTDGPDHDDPIFIGRCHGNDNNGHGNNWGGVDPSNPGQGGGGPNGQDTTCMLDIELNKRHKLHGSKFDKDGDCLHALGEERYGTDPNHPDSDGDGLPDGHEVWNGTDPLLADSDFDGLNDFLEQLLGTDPRNPDTDGDGVSDGDEVAAGTDPLRTPVEGGGTWDGHPCITDEGSGGSTGGGGSNGSGN